MVLAGTNRIERFECVGIERSFGSFYISNVAMAWALEMVLGSLQCNYILMNDTVGR